MAAVRYLGITPIACNYPFCTKEQAAFMFWRVKSWIVSAFSLSIPTEGSGQGTILERNYPYNTTIANEKQLVCLESGTEFRGNFVIETFGEFELPETIAFYMFSDLSGNFTLGAYISYFEIGGRVPESPEGSVAGDCTIMLGDNEPITFTLYNRFENSTNTLNMTIEPHSYWPYDPEDDLGPIYHKTTGRALR